jgi:hypothetical protein
MADPRQYRVYLLRVWQVLSGERLVWRASLEDPRTGERHGFADLEHLIAFLAAQSGSSELQDELDRPIQ